MSKDVKKKLLFVLLAIAVMLVIGFVPAETEAMSRTAWQYLGIFGLMLVLLITAALPDWATCLAVLALLVVFKIGTVSEVMSQFGSSTVWLVIGIFTLSIGLNNSGFLKRIALWIVTKFPGTYRGQVTAMFVSGLITSPLIPSSLAKTGVLSPLTAQVSEASGIEPSSKPALGIWTACFMGSQYMLDYVQKQYEETKKLFDAKKSCLKSGVEKYRVLWMQNMMWNNAGIMDWMEKEFNACSVMNGFPFLGRDQIEDVYDDEQIWFGLAKRCLGSPMVHSVCGPSEAYVKGIENIMNDYTIDIGIYAGHVGCKHAWAAGRMVTDVMEKKYGTPVLTFDLDSGDIRYKSTDEIKATITDFMETLAARGYDPAAERAKLLK